jgi:hypothetical protein
MENAPDIKSKLWIFFKMTKNSFVVVWWFLTFQRGQNFLADPILYENAVNHISLLSLAHLN